MSATSRIEAALEAAVSGPEAAEAPPRLAAAIRHAVFPGGARVRPQLCLAVGAACGAELPSLVEAAAVAVELLHCASLAHDDLPCFDDAATRGGDNRGAAYLVADERADGGGADGACGKPAGRDAALHRPNLVHRLGLQGAYARLDMLVAQAAAAVPECTGAKALRGLVQMQAMRLTPQRAALSAA